MKINSASFEGAVLPKNEPAAERVKQTRDEKNKNPSLTVSEPEENKSVQPEELLDKIKAMTDNGSYSVRFEMNDTLDKVVIQLVGAESGEVIRTIPPEELMGVTENLRQLRGNILNTES